MVAEALVVGTAQGAIAYGFLKTIGASDGLAVAGAASAFVNGTHAGARGIYNWRHPTGYIAATLDASVGLVGTTISNLQNIFGSAGYVGSESYRQNRFVYKFGVGMGDGPQASFAFMPGSNTVTNWESISQNLLENHETVHMWQARLFGPVYQIGTIAYMAGAAPVGFIGGALTGQSVTDGAMASGYASSPFERPAYGNQNYWPPGNRFPHDLLAVPP